jgi:hypothetical protein
MTKPQKAHAGGESLEREIVMLVLGPLSDLIEKARLEILQRIQEVDDSMGIIARHIGRKSSAEE